MCVHPSHVLQSSTIHDELLLFLHARSGGNPYYTVELAKHLLAEDVIQIDDAGMCTIAHGSEGARDALNNVPVSIESTIGALVNDLTPSQQLCLKVRADAVESAFGGTDITSFSLLACDEAHREVL